MISRQLWFFEQYRNLPSQQRSNIIQPRHTINLCFCQTLQYQLPPTFSEFISKVVSLLKNNDIYKNKKLKIYHTKAKKLFLICWHQCFEHFNLPHWRSISPIILLFLLMILQDTSTTAAKYQNPQSGIIKHPQKGQKNPISTFTPTLQV